MKPFSVPEACGPALLNLSGNPCPFHWAADRLQLSTSNSLTVSNSRNGVTFHIRCARVIAQATNDHDKTVYGLTHESWPAKGEVNEAIEREAESKEQGR